MEAIRALLRCRISDDLQVQLADIRAEQLVDLQAIVHSVQE